MADSTGGGGAATTEPAEPAEAADQPEHAVGPATARSDVSSPPVEPAYPAQAGAPVPEPAAPGPTPPAPGPTPTVGFIVNEAIDALEEAGSELRVLSAAVVLFGVAAVGIPLGPFLLFAAASDAANPTTGPDLSGIVGPAALVAVVVGLGALLILFVEIPLLIVATVGGRVAGEPLTLRQALRRSRQVFLRGFAATIAIGVATYVPAAVVQGFLFAALGPTQLALGLEILARAAFTAPWVYVLPGIVLGGVGTGEAVRRSWQLVRYRGRIALTIALLGAIGQTIVTAAENDVVGPILTVFGFAGAGATVPPDLQPIAAIGLLVVSAILLASLLFGFELVQFAPQASGFYVLTRYAAGLEAARGEQPEPLFQRRALVFYAAGIVAGVVLFANTLPLLRSV